MIQYFLFTISIILSLILYILYIYYSKKVPTPAWKCGHAYIPQEEYVGWVNVAQLLWWPTWQSGTGSGLYSSILYNLSLSLSLLYVVLKSKTYKSAALFCILQKKQNEKRTFLLVFSNHVLQSRLSKNAAIYRTVSCIVTAISCIVSYRDISVSLHPYLKLTFHLKIQWIIILPNI